MRVKLSISKEWKNKLGSDDFASKAATMESAEMTVDQVRHHLAEGYPICCAELRTQDPTRCRRVVNNFMSAQMFGVDIDGGHDINEIRNNDYIKAHAAFLYTTASHTDDKPRFRIMFVLDRPITDPSQYKRLTVVMADKFGGDRNATDAVRIWYGSENAKVVNFGKVMTSAEAIRIVNEAEEAERESVRIETFGKGQITYEELQKMLNVTPAQQEHIEYKRFISGIFNYFGKDPKVFDMLKRWSPSKVSYSKWYDGRMQRINIGTTIFIATKYGYRLPEGYMRDDPKTSADSYDHVEQYLRSVAKFRRNEITAATEFCRYDEDIYQNAAKPDAAPVETWHQLDDYFINSCMRQMGRLKIKTSKERLLQILNSDFASDGGRKYNAINEYFDSIATIELKGQDPITAFAKMIPPRKDFIEDAATQLANNVLILKRWLVAAVNCSVRNKPNHIMLILQGGQGTGKTRLLRHLCPPALREGYYYEGDIAKDKDIQRRVYTSFMAVDDELAGMSRSALEFMKSMITKDKDGIRKAYNVEDTTYRRIVNYAGTVNEQTFLEDHTGNRRFPVIPVGGYIQMIVKGKDGRPPQAVELEKFPIDMLWAHAWQLAEAGERAYFNDEELTQLQPRIGEFERSNMFDELVEKYVVDASNDPQAIPMSVTSILHEINSRQNEGERFSVDPRYQVQLGKSLARAKYEKKRKKVGNVHYKGYLVRIRTLEEAQKASLNAIRGGAYVN